MISESQIIDAAEEVMEADDSSQRQQSHTTYTWTAEGKPRAKTNVIFPKVGYWDSDPPPAGSKRETFMSSVITDDDVPLITSKAGAARTLQRFIRQVSIEQHRADPPEVELPFFERLHSEQASVRAIQPIVGASFTEPIEFTDSLRIRPITNVEKELILNHRDIGGGSLAVERTIQHGGLTHVGVYEITRELDNPYNGGLSIVSGSDETVHDILGEVETTLRLFHSDRIHQSNYFLIDDTFYPVVFSAGEPIGVGTYSEPDPAVITNTDQLRDYYELVSESQKDEGLRVALDRLASSYTTNSNADGIVDVVIGIEAILSAGKNGSFRNVRRKAAVLIDEKSADSDLRQYSKIRNATVHGEERTVDREDLQDAREVLSKIIARMLRLQIETDRSREEVLEELDYTIDVVIREQFEELVETFDLE